MLQVIEYILNNYTWFLVGIVLVLLAIVGYYADKTNFGQNKKNTSKENDTTEESNKSVNAREVVLIDENKTAEKDKINNLEVQIESSDINNNLILQNDNNVTNGNVLPDDNLNSSVVENTNTDSGHSNINEMISNNLSDNSSNTIEITSSTSSDEKKVNVVNEENTLQINEEKFNMFSKEFESLLPKKNIINTDLLSDIDDLELDKTQKIDLSGVPDLDDIDLPKIMELSAENDDIWKI